MNNLTWFGWLYLILVIGGVIYAISQIDEPREPRTRTEVIFNIFFSAFFVWGVFYVGVTNG